MRIAILISGQPRFLYEGSGWFKHKVFPESKNIKVDYYCHFWDNGDPNLENIVNETFSPVKYKIENYDNTIRQFIDKVQTENKKLNDWNNVPDSNRFLQLFDQHEISPYAYNFWGQYLGASKLTELVGNLSGSYDIVIKTRSDAIFNNMSESLWLKCLSNIHRNPWLKDKMFSQWLYVNKGIPYIGDFAFIARPEVYYNFSKDIEQHCFKLATSDKALWKELEVANFEHPPHWIWSKLSMYSRSDWLSFGVVWPNPFNVVLVRDYSENILSETYQSLQHKFDEHASKHK